MAAADSTASSSGECPHNRTNNPPRDMRQQGVKASAPQARAQPASPVASLSLSLSLFLDGRRAARCNLGP